MQLFHQAFGSAVPQIKPSNYHGCNLIGIICCQHLLQKSRLLNLSLPQVAQFDRFTAVL